MKPLVLRKEDYKEAPTWMGRLFVQLNEWLTAVTATLTQGITRAENMRSVVKVITFTTAPTAINTFPQTVRHGLGQKPTDIWVGRLRRIDAAAMTDAWSFSWALDAKGDLAVTFQGLSGSASYEVRLIIE